MPANGQTSDANVRVVNRQRDKRILALALPALSSLAVEPLYTLVDTGIVARLGKAPLGGLALASTVLGTGFWVFHFLQEGTTTEVATRWGRGDKRSVADTTVQALWLSLILGLIISALTYVGATLLAGALGGTGGVLKAATTYLRVSAVGIPFLFVSLVGHGFLRGVEAIRATVPVVIVANVVNIILEVLLVNVWHTGVAGSAWGTVIAQIIACAWLLVLLRQRLRGVKVDSTSPRPSEWRRLVQVGGWLFVRTGLLIAMFALATRAAARMGDAVLGGHQIAYQVFIFFALSTDALAIAAQTLTGTLIGQGNLVELRALMKRMWRMAWIVGVTLTVIVGALAIPIAHLLSRDPDIVHAATLGLFGVAALQIPGAAAFLTDGELMGAADFNYLAKAMGLTTLVFIPMWAVIMWRPSLGITSIWASLIIMISLRGWLGWRRSQTRQGLSATDTPLSQTP